MTTTETLTFQRLVEKYPHDVPPIEVARDILAYFAIDGEAADVLLPPLAYQVGTVQRNKNRALEAKVRKGERDEVRGEDSEERMTLPDLRRQLMERSFFNGKGMVLWGEATIADHEGRIEYQRGQIAGCQTNIEQHQAAIAEIAAAGVTCLNEVPL
jgi:hypothetical protein